MSTTVYGASDDLIEFEGDVTGEVGAYGYEDDNGSVLLIFSDGTLLKCWYGEEGIWCLRLLAKGELLDHIDTCTDSLADPHSDVAHFKDGLRWAYQAKEWGLVG